MKRKLALLGVGVLVVLLLAGVGQASLLVWFWGKAYPGVRVAGIDVAGKNGREIEEIVRNVTTGRGRVVAEWEGQAWEILPADIGFYYDTTETTRRALEVGRKNIFWFPEEKNINVAYKVDEERLGKKIGEISSQIDVPLKEAEVVLENSNGVKSLKTTPGTNGRLVLDNDFRQMIAESLELAGPTTLVVPVKILEPRLSVNLLSMIEPRAGRVFDKKVQLKTTDDEQMWEINDEQIVAWMDPVTAWQDNEIQSYVNEFAIGFDRPAQNAAFRYENGKVKEFRPGKSGVEVVREEMVKQIKGTLIGIENGSENDVVVIPVRQTEPAIKTGDVNTFGIKDLLGVGESWYTGSIENRIFNLSKAAENMDGVLVAPGEVFSFNKHVGDISIAGGYKPGYIIKDGKTVLGDGGGVCQASSTMFRAALNAGLPIEERWAHAYRVSYYEINTGPGFDATIFTPSVDLRWKNDTGGYVLIQTKIDRTKNYLAFELYGTSDGRKASVSKARVWDRIAPPPTLYIDDPNLARGKTRVAEHSIYGAKVAFDWKVTRGTEVLQERTFFSNFQPWQGVYYVGTR